MHGEERKEKKEKKQTKKEKEKKNKKEMTYAQSSPEMRPYTLLD